MVVVTPVINIIIACFVAEPLGLCGTRCGTLVWRLPTAIQTCMMICALVALDFHGASWTGQTKAKQDIGFWNSVVTVDISLSFRSLSHLPIKSFLCRRPHDHFCSRVAHCYYFLLPFDFICLLTRRNTGKHDNLEW